MKVIRWLLPLTSLLLVLAFTWWDLQRTATGPGPLHPAHAGRAELAGGASCEACHRRGAGIDQEACTRCHAAISAALATRTGLHGSLPAKEIAHCERCHSEHHGDSVPLIAPHAFARAGVPNAAAYDHRHVSFWLAGAHARLSCVNCHNQAESLEASVQARFLGLSQQCGSCHDDVHRAAFGPDCESCHGQDEPWPQAPLFAHAAFSLEGAHGKVVCARCHEPGSAHDVPVLRQQSVVARACDACHSDPHGAQSAPATALQLLDTADCTRCHTTSRWLVARPTATAHAKFGFPLRGPHASAECAKCHGDATRTPRWSQQPPELAACGACHEHPHGSELMAAATSALGPAAGCADCHVDTDTHFATGRISAIQHAATGFALQAPHAELACASCHTGTQRSERFPGRTAGDCRACHRDVHGAQFQSEPRYAQCTACHETTHFVPSAFGIASHRATAFPLTGAHDAVGCVNCHARQTDGVRMFRGTASECAACHDDVHRGTFDRAGRAKVVDCRQGCARCHDTVAFAPAIVEFDHGRWTGYSLAGAHDAAACGKCHAAAASGKRRPRLGPVAGTSCAACHQDPHAGQFANGGATDCARCHDEVRWQTVRFDHQQQSRFALDGVHAKLPCGKCHVAYASKSGLIVRYKPLGTTCGDCHRLGAAGEVVK